MEGRISGISHQRGGTSAAVPGPKPPTLRRTPNQACRPGCQRRCLSAATPMCTQRMQACTTVGDPGGHAAVCLRPAHPALRTARLLDARDKHCGARRQSNPSRKQCTVCLWNGSGHMQQAKYAVHVRAAGGEAAEVYKRKGVGVWKQALYLLLPMVGHSSSTATG